MSMRSTANIYKIFCQEKTVLFALSLVFVAVLMLSACSDKCEEKGGEDDQVESPVASPSLSNQKVTSFAEDSKGHIWIGTFRGLNKYDVHEYHQYFCTDDSLDLPDNQICDLMRDSRGRLWISTVNGLCLYTDRDNFRRIPQDYENKNGRQIIENADGRIFVNAIHQLAVYDPQSDSLKLAIRDFDPHHTFYNRCFISRDNRLWSVTRLGLKCYNSTTLAVEDSLQLPHLVNYSYLQQNGLLWLSGPDGLMIYDTFHHRMVATPPSISSHPILNKAQVTLIHPYGTAALIMVTEQDGLFLYNFKSGRVIHQSEQGFPFVAPKFKVSSIFTDSQQNIWIGSVDQGYSVVYNYKERFNTDNYLVQALDHKSVTSVAVDSHQNLWISTLMDGLYIYNVATHTVKSMPMGSYSHDIGRVFVDNADRVWLLLTSKNKALQCHYDGTSLIFDSEYDLFMPISITQDRRGTVWIGTCSYLTYALPQGETQMKEVAAFPRTGTFIPGLLSMSDEIWVMAFAKPIMSININDFSVNELKISDDEWKACIRRSVYIPTASFRDSRGDVWLGTVSNGLLHYSASTHKITTVAGTPCRDIAGIEEDAQGNIWVSTQYGLGKYDRTTNRFTNYFAPDGIGGNQFYDRSSCRLADGTLVFGGTHGLTLFNPIDVSTKRTVPLVFEDLKIHNTLERPSAKGAAIDKHLSDNPHVRLKHYQNGFSISFSALDYCEYDRAHYFYRMEGFDKYWIDAHNNREAYYANLPAGSYTFRVRAVNNDNSITETENSLRITIEPAPWNSWWAWIIYILIAAALVYFIYRVYCRIRAARQAVRQAEIEKQQEQRVNRMNMSFFANVSHEFRTPLTMIAGPVDSLCESQTIGDSDRQLLLIVKRSVRRMLRLVNQMMDFNKLENDTLKLRVRRSDVIQMLQSFIDIFAVNAHEKGITLTTYGIEDSFTAWIDADKLDKIVGNLLSNAMKFTPRGGRVDVSFDADADSMRIIVADTGSGIPADQTEKIFERYYQLNNQQTGTYNWGTGIGLYYARSLARLHHGSLSASNRKEGHGAVFTLILPLADEAYSSDERETIDAPQSQLFPLDKLNYDEKIDRIDSFDSVDSIDSLDINRPKSTSLDDNKSRPTLLVVDDDTEVVHYMKALFEPHYNVVCCFSADSAYETMNDNAPDLVVSDVVMPGMSGYDLCRKIKQSLQLCHIPVILLTAKATTENQVEGLDTGADAYVTKPFDPKYLLALVRSQLSNREKVRSILSQSTETADIAAEVLSPQDNAFMTKLYQLMESELSNPELDVARLTTMLGISRTKFYYKVKALTGESPSVFFKTYKLNRAAQLIAEGQHTVSEIAYMAGFSSPSHFSTSFKRQFGVAPSEYNPQ